MKVASKPATKRKKAQPLAIIDMGPRVQRDRKDTDHGPRLVVVSEPEEPGNPESPTIRRARRVWVPDTLCDNGSLSIADWLACRRLVAAMELGVDGAREKVAVYVQAGGKAGGPGDMQLDALKDYREAMRALGIRHASVVSACVLSHWSLRRYAEEQGISDWLARKRMVEAARVLSDHYASPKRGGWHPPG